MYYMHTFLRKQSNLTAYIHTQINTFKIKQIAVVVVFGGEGVLGREEAFFYKSRLNANN